jgi:predicted ATP-dependent endonuclease of OLD family
MKLKNLTINGFRSVKQKESLRVDEKVTILIGANDHGKTNLLDAIACLNDDKQIKPEDMNWDLGPNDVTEIEWHFDCDPEVKKKLDEFKVPAEVATPEGTSPTPKPPIFSTNDQNEIVYVRNSKENKVKVLSVPLEIAVTKEAEILKFKPKVELFEAPKNNLKDTVTSAQLITGDYEFMQGLFRLAEIWDQKDTIFAHNDTTSKLLDKASDTLTKKLREQWNQGKDLSWRLKHIGTNGDNIVIEIQDPSIDNRYTRPSYRSSGFKTYFLLSMIISARTQKNPSNSFIYLFDEPGTYLHPRAQLDLQKSFESISDESQLIYTTHSLFLVSKNHPSRNRVISKTIDGTKIDQKPFIRNWKAVRDSLGILLSNNFLIADKTLLVEGPSDGIYILDSIRKLKETNKIDMDLNDLSIVDAGNQENYVAMAKLMLSEGRSVVAVVDGDGGGESITEQLDKICSKELKNKSLQLITLPKNKSVEDICADIERIRVAIKNVFNNLTKANARKAVSEIKIDEEIKKISPSANQTFGKIIDDTSKNWFDPKEKISKLSIAIEYEKLEGKYELPASAESVLKDIQAFLGIQGERPEKKIFEEIDK